jgi:hypothetical protein
VRIARLLLLVLVGLGAAWWWKVPPFARTRVTTYPVTVNPQAAEIFGVLANNWGAVSGVSLEIPPLESSPNGERKETKR